MYHLRMDARSGDVLVRMDILSIYPLDQSSPGWWTDRVLGIGDVRFFVSCFFDVCLVRLKFRFNYVIDTYLWSAASALAGMSKYSTYYGVKLMISCYAISFRCWFPFVRFSDVGRTPWPVS